MVRRVPLAIDADFESGNIEVRETKAYEARLAIRPDPDGKTLQWFHFRVRGARGERCTFIIENAGRASFPYGWKDYRAVVSDDGESFRRAETEYADEALRFSFTPADDEAWCAYFAPYVSVRRQRKLAEWSAAPGVRAEECGRSLDGQPIHVVTVPAVGREDRRIWVVARQHAGESQGEWWAEGFLDRLALADDPLVRFLRERATVRVVPCMNPDGAARGHLRGNAIGVDLNREWASPDPQRSPEVFAVRREIEATGVDLFLDVHGDESLPHNFIVGAVGVRSWDTRRELLLREFKETYAEASPDFQTRVGYPRISPGRANLGLSASQLAHRFGCLAMTLEQPFKDAADNPDDRVGWSPERSRALGAAALIPMARVLSALR